MVIIQFKNGWGASNEASISNTPKLVATKDSKVKSFKDELTLNVKDLFIVDGSFSGDVKIALRDSSSNELKCYNGTVINDNKVLIHGETSSEWLEKI